MKPETINVKPQKMTPTELNTYIRSRRSTFIDQFESGKSIPDEVIWQILENANHAPTHKRTEPWRFFVFSGEGLQILAREQARIYKEGAGEKFKQAKYDKMLTSPLQCSHIIAIVMKRHEGLPEMEEIAATACAVENIYLSLAAYGIGGYWSTGGITFMKGAKNWLQLEDQDLLLGFFQLGYIKLPSQPRIPGDIKEKVCWFR